MLAWHTKVKTCTCHDQGPRAYILFAEGGGLVSHAWRQHELAAQAGQWDGAKGLSWHIRNRRLIYAPQLETVSASTCS